MNAYRPKRIYQYGSNSSLRDKFINSIIYIIGALVLLIILAAEANT